MIIAAIRCTVPDKEEEEEIHDSDADDAEMTDAADVSADAALLQVASPRR